MLQCFSRDPGDGNQLDSGRLETYPKIRSVQDLKWINYYSQVQNYKIMTSDHRGMLDTSF